MPTEYQVLEGIENAIRIADSRSDNNVSVPSNLTYFVGEIDSSEAQPYINPPALEIRPTRVDRLTNLNDDLVGMIEDEDGNEVGYLYENRYEMQAEVNVWTAEGSPVRMNGVAESVRTALKPYDDYVRQQGRIDWEMDHLPSTPDPSTAEEMCLVRRFALGTSMPAHDFAMSPNLRRWTQEVTVQYGELTDTVELYGEVPYIDTIEFDESVSEMGGFTWELDNGDVEGLWMQ